MQLTQEDLQVSTQGLSGERGFELRVQFDSAELTEEAKQFLQYILDYEKKTNKLIKPEETFGYGYWITQFKTVDPGFVDVWEYNKEATEYVPGVSLTLTYWKDQHAVCQDANADFRPPRADQLVALSEGVFEGDPVQGVRYPSPEHMSGWWITTDRFNGDVNTLKTEHLYHLTTKRPDLAKYIALPFGYRFDTKDKERVWFDKEVADKPAEE